MKDGWFRVEGPGGFSTGPASDNNRLIEKEGSMNIQSRLYTLVPLLGSASGRNVLTCLL